MENVASNAGKETVFPRQAIAMHRVRLRGRMHNHLMASLNSPIAEFLPPVDVQVGKALF